MYSHTDVIGVELGGALKNVIATRAGILEDSGLASTRGGIDHARLAEITRLGVALGAQAMTFAGLAGLGDLILTATGALSRNRGLGVALGQGNRSRQRSPGHRPLSKASNGTHRGRTGERHNVELPIAREVANVLFQNKPPRQAVSDLMERELKRKADEQQHPRSTGCRKFSRSVRFASGPT